MSDTGVTRELESFRTKFFYGLGSIAYGIKDNGFATIVLLFYNQVVGLPSQLVGFAIMVALVIDAFVDPIIGQISDNTRSRWGRRHPFMYASALPVAVFYLLLWNPPHWSHGALFLYLVTVAVVIRTFISFYEVPSSALSAELTKDYDQRTSFLGYRFFFGWFGGLGMYLLAFRVFLQPDAAHPVGQLNPVGYSHYGLTAAVLMFAAILISAAGTHRYIKYLPAAPQRRVGTLTLFREMFSTLKNRSFMILFVSGLFFYLATGIAFALGQYFQIFLWVLNSDQVFWLTCLGIFSAGLAFAVAMPTSTRYGKKNAAIVMFIFALAFWVLPLSLRLMGLFFENSSPYLVPALAIQGLLTGTFGIASSILLASMLADIVEDSERQTGRRSEGLFFAANSFLQKSLSGLGIFAATIMLAVVHFPAKATPATLDPHIIHNLTLLFVPTLFVLYGISLVIVSRYSITREGHEENLRSLAAEAVQAAEPVDLGITPP
jgi:Na+/melibiose symporter-like transporter